MDKTMDKNLEKNLAVMSLLDQEAKETIEKLQYLVFQSRKGFFGINILDTFEILKPVPVTRLPNVSEEVLGVINLRGNIIPVIDTNKKFSNYYAEIGPSTRIVVCAHKGKYMGLLVDRVVEVARISEEEVEGAEVRGLSNRFVEGVGRSDDKIFLIMNLAVLFSEQARTLEEGSSEGVLHV